MKGRRHTPEEVVRKRREPDRLLGEGTKLPEIWKMWEVSEATYTVDGAQDRGMKADEVKRLKERELERVSTRS